MASCIRRREFIAGIGGAVAWPLGARAQQGDRVRRIGVLMPWDENDPVAKTFVSAFTQAVADLGWTDGRNVRMELWWYGDDSNRLPALALYESRLPSNVGDFATQVSAETQKQINILDSMLQSIQAQINDNVAQQSKLRFGSVIAAICTAIRQQCR